MRPIDADDLLEIIEKYCGDYDCHDSESFDKQAVRMAIRSAPTLTPQNEPLTIEQLREMDGEPVWIKRLKGLSVCDTGWAVVDVCPNQIRVWWPGSEVEDKPSEKDYGKTWIAYRRPPERQGGDANHA